MADAESSVLPSGQWTSRLPGRMGADLRRPRNEPLDDRSSTGEQFSTCRSTRSSEQMSTSSLLAPVSGSISRWIIELNCFPRHVETKKVRLKPDTTEAGALRSSQEVTRSGASWSPGLLFNVSAVSGFSRTRGDTFEKCALPSGVAKRPFPYSVLPPHCT